MKIMKLLVISLISILIFGCIKDERSEHVKQADKLMAFTKKQLEKEFNLKLIGEGGQMMHDIQVMDLEFVSKETLNIDQARKLVIKCSNIFLNNINNSTEIRPYLHDYPATEKNIELILYFQINGKSQKPPYVAIAGLTKGKMVYYYQYDDDLKEILKESYAEALKKIQE